MTIPTQALDWLRAHLDSQLALTPGYPLEDLQLRVPWSTAPVPLVRTRDQLSALRSVLADAERYESHLIVPAKGTAAKPKNGSTNVRVYRHREIGGNPALVEWVKPQLLQALQGLYGLRTRGLVGVVEWAGVPLQDVGGGHTRDYAPGFGHLASPDIRERVVKAALAELQAACLVYPESYLTWEAGKRHRVTCWRPGVPRAPQPLTPEQIKENRRRFFTGLG